VHQLANKYNFDNIKTLHGTNVRKMFRMLNLPIPSGGTGLKLALSSGTILVGREYKNIPFYSVNN